MTSNKMPWLAPALAVWVVIAAIALANTTAVPVHAGAVTMVYAGLAAGYGLTRQRWRVAGPLALLAVASTGVVAFALPAIDINTIYTGPAETTGIKFIWVMLTVIVACEIGWGIYLHTRMASHTTHTRDIKSLTEQHAQGNTQLSHGLGDLTRRLNHVERLLTDAG